MSMNATTPPPVIQMPPVPTIQDLINVHARTDIMEMDSTVQVYITFLL